MNPRVYVAAPFTEWPLVRIVQAELRQCGATITEDWTAGIESLPPGLTDGDISEAEAFKAAVADVRGVTSADACIFLTVADKTKGRGMYVELGIAIALNVFGDSASLSSDEGLRERAWNQRRIAVCGPHRDSTIFSRLGRRFADWRDSLPYVLGE